MKYNLKTNNFSSFKKLADNLLIPRSYFIPFHSAEKLFETDIRNERYKSDMVDCLSGEWDFIYYKNCNDIHENFDTDNTVFDKVAVPSTWQHTGYEEPYYVNARYQFAPNPPDVPSNCPAGVYRRFIDIEDIALNYVIAFLGVSGGLDFFCNGKYVGYSEGSHNTAQFELNDFLKNGKNEIVVVNHKYCNGTYLECQDMFRCNGIFRDVLLYKTGDNSIYDFEAKTEYINDNNYKLTVLPSLKLKSECQLTVSLCDDGELISSKSVNVSAEEISAVTFDKLSVNEWSAEKPYLYELVITLSSKGECKEIIRKNIGFKHIEIDGNKFLFNNQPIKLLGVNHHDTNPKTGCVMTMEDMERDVKIVKEYNANCIRTSHYPPDPSFLDFCDEYGIYVIDEADIEAHGCQIEVKNWNICSDNPKWQEHYWDRVYRMFERDKNHPSVTMWSLGNEAGGIKNQDYCYDELKKLSPIPIHYEGAIRTKRWAYDVVSQMYSHQNLVKKIGRKKQPKKYRNKPFFLCEFAHAMGVGAGGLEDYVSHFYNYDNLLGGCIWEFVDHAIYHENGKYEYTYGGDHGEEKHDGNFCVDGLFFPDRSPHSGALQMKACFRPVRAKKINFKKYSFFNHLYFENAKLDVKYTLVCNGENVKTGDFKLDIEPQKSEQVKLDDLVFDAEKNTVIRFDYFDSGKIVASEEIELLRVHLGFNAPKTNAPAVQKSENRLFIYFDGGRMIFDKKTAFIDSYIYNGEEFINQVPSSDFRGLGLQFYRAPLDNDMNINRVWEKFRLESQSSFVKNCKYTVESNCIKIDYTVTVKTPVNLRVAQVDVMLMVFADGSIKFDFLCKKGGMVRLVPRFGAQLEMPKEFKNVKYFGLGPCVNLPDFREHAVTGIYETTVDGMREEYIKPQESALRCETRFAEITNDSGIGIRFEALENPFVFSANPFTPQQCAKAKHKEDLTKNTTCINVDGAILGAGSNSCGPLPTKEYFVGKLKGKKLSFVIKPIGD